MAIKSLNAMIKSYKQNMTRSSANPKLDGSALKKSLMTYMTNLQDNIASIVEQCYMEQQRLTQLETADVDTSDDSIPPDDASGENPQPPTNQDEDPQPTGTPSERRFESKMKSLEKSILEAMIPTYDAAFLTEDAERENKIQIVQDQERLMRKLYLDSLSSALETVDRGTATQNASEMLSMAKKEEFISLFPSYVGTYEGRPVSIDDALSAIDGLVKEFIETMKNVITLAKGQLLEENSLTKVIDDLGMISQTIENYFSIKSKKTEDLKKKVKKLLSKRKQDQSLSKTSRELDLT